jgi:hypothetical protein
MKISMILKLLTTHSRKPNKVATPVLLAKTLMSTHYFLLDFSWSIGTYSSHSAWKALQAMGCPRLYFLENFLKENLPRSFSARS